jgi:hypothetical protein
MILKRRCCSEFPKFISFRPSKIEYLKKNKGLKIILVYEYDYNISYMDPRTIEKSMKRTLLKGIDLTDHSN